MHIVCPNCEFEQDVPDEKIPPRARLATCPKCGQKFHFRGDTEAQEDRTGFDFTDPIAEEGTQEASDEPSESEGEKSDIWEQLESLTEEETESGEEFNGVFNDVRGRRGKINVPWERLEEHGFFPGMFETVKQVLSTPTSFFQNMNTKNGLNKPLIFYLLIAEIQALAQFFWQFTGVFSTMDSQPESLLGMGLMGAGSVFILVLYPVFLAIGLFIGSGINHLCLLAVQAGEKGYEGTFRVMSYASAPMVFAVVPVVGALVGVVWNIVCMVIGLMYVHRASAGQVVLAMLLPLIVVLLALTLFAVLGAIF